MPDLIQQPSRVAAAGEPTKLIDEYIGLANTGHDSLSIAHMRSPAGWAGQGVHARAGEWVRYSTPDEGGAEYISACLPAFSPDTVHRDE